MKTKRLMILENIFGICIFLALVFLVSGIYLIIFVEIWQNRLGQSFAHELTYVACLFCLMAILIEDRIKKLKSDEL